MKVLSRNKTIDSTSGSSKSRNGSLGQQQQGKSWSRLIANSGDQLDKSNQSRRGLGLRGKGYHLKNVMRQEISRHRGSDTRSVSPDTTEESSCYSGSEGSWDEASMEENIGWEGFFGGCGAFDDDSYTADFEDDASEIDSMASPAPIMPPNGPKQRKTNKIKTTESQKGYPTQLMNVLNRHRDSNVRAPPDTPEESSFGSGSEGDYLDEASRVDTNGCGAFEECGILEYETITDNYGDSFTDIDGDSSSCETSVASSDPIGMPGMCGISDWLFAAEYDHSQSDVQARKSEVAGIYGEAPVDKKAELNNHQGQLDIYAKSPESLRLRRYSSAPRPESSNHILVKVDASTVSIHDYLERSSGCQEVPGRQVTGEVYRVGGKVGKRNKIHVGDRIVALTPFGKGNARYISIPVSSAIPIPSNIQRDDAICLVETYMSAYQMLNLGRTNRVPFTDANVLIIGGSNPVGLALVELALKEGAKVMATSAKPHRAYLEKMGATWLPNKPKKISKLRKKMDLVIDTLCLDGYKSSYEALNSNGKLVCTTNPPIRNHGSIFDRMGRSWSRFSAAYILSNVSFYDVHKSFQDDPRMFEHELKYLLIKLRNKEIQPKISGRISLNQVPKAQKLVEQGLPNGTIVVLPWGKLDPTQDVPVDHVH